MEPLDWGLKRIFRGRTKAEALEQSEQGCLRGNQF